MLPGPSGATPTAPPGLRSFLAEKADGDGMLPPWTKWWGPEISGLFPSADLRASVEREEQRMPLSYFAESVEAPEGWDSRPGAFLAFGDGYADERAAAAKRGWPVRTLDGEHLHMLMNPGQVATAIADLAREIA